MLAGHFGLAAAVKSREPQVPLWALMLSTQLLGVVFLVLYAFGVETLGPAPGLKANYGSELANMDYSHSLVGALVISLLGLIITAVFWGRRNERSCAERRQEWRSITAWNRRRKLQLMRRCSRRARRSGVKLLAMACGQPYRRTLGLCPQVRKELSLRRTSPLIPDALQGKRTGAGREMASRLTRTMRKSR